MDNLKRDDHADTLLTPHLRLRPFRLDDADRFHARIHNDAEVMRFLPGGAPRPREATLRTLDYFLSHWAQHGFGMWAVEDNSDGAFVGQAGLNVIPNTSEVEVAYALAKPYWGKGYAAEAARAALGYGFERVGLAIVYAVAFPANLASQRVMQKLGMEYEGVTNRFYDTELVCYFMRRERWQSPLPPAAPA